jgi:hypothetical protein
MTARTSTPATTGDGGLLVSEATGTALTLDFEVTGPIPSTGLRVEVRTMTPEVLRQFTAAQVRFPRPPLPFWRLDQSVVDTATGAIVDRETALENDPTSPGFLSNLSFTIVQPRASLTFRVLDDLLEEADRSFTYTLIDGPGFGVQTPATVTFTVTDGVPAAAGPTVGVAVTTPGAATPGVLNERTQDVVEVTFTVTGTIPAGGLVVEFSSDTPRAVAEFDVNAANPRLTEDAGFTVMGPVISPMNSGSIVGTNEIASAILYRILTSPSTIRVPVYAADELEGRESFVWQLRDGETYQVSPTASTALITIVDN